AIHAATSRVTKAHRTGTLRRGVPASRHYAGGTGRSDEGCGAGSTNLRPRHLPGDAFASPAGHAPRHRRHCGRVARVEAGVERSPGTKEGTYMKAGSHNRDGRRLRPVSGFMFDLDGTLVLSDRSLNGYQVLPGAIELLGELKKRDVPFVVLTNGT